MKKNSHKILLCFFLLCSSVTAKVYTNAPMDSVSMVENGWFVGAGFGSYLADAKREPGILTGSISEQERYGDAW